MPKPTFKVVNIRWWNLPVPLMTRKSDSSLLQIGWVWRQRAYLVKNSYLGWIAIDDYQTKENLDIWFCPCCGNSLDMQISKFETYFKEKEKHHD